EVLSRDIVVQKTLVNIPNLLDDLVDDFSPAQQKRLFIEKITDHTIETDLVLLRSILGELIINGLEHNPDTKVSISSPEEGLFWITNYGPAISPDILSKIFYPFFSLKAKNLGLGLTISKLQAESMGASLKLIQNSVDEGITFEINITN